MMKKHYCSYPFAQITTTPTGYWKLCCSAAEAHGFTSEFKGEILHKISEVPMDEYWNGPYLNWVREKHLKNEPIKECEACFRYEQEGAQSYRQRALKELGTFTEKTTNPISLDLKLGNLCNASCLFCDPSSSSRVMDEWQKIGWSEQTPFSHGLTGPVDKRVFEIDYKWPEREDFWKKLQELSGDLRNLKFTGGEPLINPYMIQYLRFLVEKDLAKNIRLQTTSNGIKVPDEFLELTHYFREVQLNFSVDGYGKQNEYIRFPTKWDAWLKNIERVEKTVGPHVELNFQHSISAYSIFGLTDYFRWMWPFKRFGFHLFRVYHPDFQQPEVLEKSQALVQADRLQVLIDELKPQIACPRDERILREMGAIVLSLRTQEDKSFMKGQLKAFLLKLEGHRKISIRDYMPEAARYLEM